jgi:tetratricopeptide (TPR) repeat protein
LAVLELLGRKEALVLAIDRIRSDPFADAGLLAAGASALRRIGQDAEGRRAFGELVERAPGDPWTLAFAGDRLRAENLFDEAVANYDSLARALPDDPAVSLRLALAHAGAGRLDVATRLLERVAQNGGRGDDGRLGELASMTQAVLLASARSVSAGPDVDAQLMRRLVQTPLPDVKSLVVITMPPTEDAIRVSVARERAEHDEQPADLDAPSLGLAAVRIERGEGLALIRLKRPANPDATRTAHATVSALILAEDRAASRVVTRQVDVAPNGVAIELRWNGESFL